MTLSLRARLTLWYSAIVVAVLLGGGLASLFVQGRLGLERQDDELARLMLTLEGVMRTEINEGLTLQASAEEASAEVVAPDRMLVLVTPDGRTLASWGMALPPHWSIGRTMTGHQTIDDGWARVRFFRRDIAYKGHSYTAVVGVPLAGLDAEHRELVEALLIGLLVGLVLAGVGGWWVGRRMLRPLEDMAMQAAEMTDSISDQRLTAPHPEDELGRLAASFNGLLDRLGTALNAQRQFMADASHELRTPVSIVRATAQVALRRDDRASDDYRDSLAIVAEQTARITRLVDAMFLLARAEASGIPMTREALYLDDLVAESARGLRVLARERNIDVRIEQNGEFAFFGDASLLRQMVGNLLDNAVRHARPGGLVTIRLRRAGPTISLAVRDDGPGVANQDRERIFERFVRLDSRSTGAGLGLPIARWVAQAHGGELVLAPGEDRGSEFVVTLPAT
ncbi:MAG TPA: ATP-binding protein [Vicinamibacterales bacterium]